MTLIDPQKDTVSGAWKIQDGRLVSNGVERAILEIPYRPSGGVRLPHRVQTAWRGSGDVEPDPDQGPEKPFAWVMGGMGNTNSGFGENQRQVGRPKPPNPSLVKFRTRDGQDLRLARRSPGRTALKATVNGVLICQWKTNYGDMGVEQGLASCATIPRSGLGHLHQPDDVSNRIENPRGERQPAGNSARRSPARKPRQLRTGRGGLLGELGVRFRLFGSNKRPKRRSLRFLLQVAAARAIAPSASSSDCLKGSTPSGISCPPCPVLGSSSR